MLINRTADLRLCFHIRRKPVFSHCGSCCLDIQKGFRIIELSQFSIAMSFGLSSGNMMNRPVWLVFQGFLEFSDFIRLSDHGSFVGRESSDMALLELKFYWSLCHLEMLLYFMLFVINMIRQF